MRITKHAQARIQERAIPTEELVHCITHGVRLVNRNDPSKTTIVDNKINLYIVTDKAETTVITVFRKEK